MRVTLPVYVPVPRGCEEQAERIVERFRTEMGKG
jgi:hypothetical protein